MNYNEILEKSAQQLQAAQEAKNEYSQAQNQLDTIDETFNEKKENYDQLVLEAYAQGIVTPQILNRFGFHQPSKKKINEYTKQLGENQLAKTIDPNDIASAVVQTINTLSEQRNTMKTDGGDREPVEYARNVAWNKYQELLSEIVKDGFVAKGALEAAGHEVSRKRYDVTSDENQEQEENQDEN